MDVNLQLILIFVKPLPTGLFRLYSRQVINLKWNKYITPGNGKQVLIKQARREKACSHFQMSPFYEYRDELLRLGQKFGD